MFDKKEWTKKWREKNRDVINEKRRAYRKRRPDIVRAENQRRKKKIKKWFDEHAEWKKAYDRERRNRIRFGGNYDLVLERDNRRCVFCGTGEKLMVHHKDENGRGKENPNNDIENLVTVCASCHPRLHVHWTKKKKVQI